ncbi:MAG: prepilin-type N-terminal cleavage/methylation domain-containing protein [Chlamydiota bacterium]
MTRQNPVKNKISLQSESAAKRLFTLLEVLIGLSLASILLGALFFALRTQSILAKKLDPAHHQVSAEVHVQQVISKTLLKLTSFYTSKSQKGLILYFTIRDQVDIHPNFNGSLEGYLSIELVDGCSCFCLTQKSRINHKERREILLRDIKDVRCEFLSETAEGWKATTSWEKEKEPLPCFIYLTTISCQGDEIPFVFWLSNRNKPILYSYNPSPRLMIAHLRLLQKAVLKDKSANFTRNGILRRSLI